MKIFPCFLFLVISLVCCQSDSLSPERAQKIISQEAGYPKPFAVELNLVDPLSVEKIRAIGLDTSGLVELKDTRSSANWGKPKILVTQKGKPFLLGPPEGSAAEDAQMVKIADQQIGEVKVSMSGDGNHATVEYQVLYKNITPFKSLVSKDLNAVDVKTRYLTKVGGQWKLTDRPEDGAAALGK